MGSFSPFFRVKAAHSIIILCFSSYQLPIGVAPIGQRNRSANIGSGQTVGLDEKTLKAVAEMTKGQYFYAAETKELTQIYSDLSSRIAWVNESTEITAYVAGLGTLLFLIGGVLSLRWFQQFP